MVRILVKLTTRHRTRINRYNRTGALLFSYLKRRRDEPTLSHIDQKSLVLKYRFQQSGYLAMYCIIKPMTINCKLAVDSNISMFDEKSPAIYPPKFKGTNSPYKLVTNQWAYGPIMCNCVNYFSHSQTTISTDRFINQ